ncbi:MAG TPA: DUF916 domain-containing protein [Rugosimonospora sp.]|nr:DUF916 domain-containing protein [Rugosimonospora sp.]
MRRQLVAAGLALAAVAATVSPARAATPAGPPAKDDGVRVWSVRPAGPDGKPDARTHFTLQSPPGGRISEKALVTNLSKVPVTFAVYGTDAFNTTTGQFDLLSAEKKPRDVGAWMAFGSGAVTVGAGQSVAVPFTVNVPLTATPGDHAGGVVVSLLGRGTDGQRLVNVDSRVAVRLYLRVPGNLVPRIGVGPVAVRYHGVANPFGNGRVSVTYTVTNPGNIRLRSRQTLTVTGPFGAKLATLDPADLPELLPGNQATFTATLSRVFPAGPLTVTVDLQPYADPQQPVGQTIHASTGHGYLWAVPWLLLGLVLLLAAGGVVFWRLRRRRTLSRLDAAMRAAREDALRDKEQVSA